MKDERIRYRPAERAALLNYQVRSFCLTSGNLTGRQMAEQMISHRKEIWRRSGGSDAALFAVSQGPLREIALND